MSVAGVALLCATAPTCCSIARSRTASKREVCYCGMIDLGTETKQIATAIQQHVDVPHVPVAAHCAAAAAAAAGRQGCSVVCIWD